MTSKATFSNRLKLVIHKSGYLVLVTKDAQEHESIFEGVQIDGAYDNGTFMPDWYKANFSLFSDSVLLEQ
jgi:hypothetical protein